MSLPKGLAEFIAAQKGEEFPRSKWFNDKKINVYVRVGRVYSYTGSGVVQGITIANVTAHKLREGIFTEFVNGLIALSKQHGYAEIQIENAITEGMLAWCQKFNLKEKRAAHDYFQTRSFYLKVGSEGDQNA